MEILVIAEIGINHNGDIEVAKKLIDVAKQSGANAVKFQKRDVNLVYSKSELDIPRESPWGTTTREQKHGLEFGREAYDEIDRYCREQRIEWFASAWDLNSRKFLEKYNLKYNKIASAMLVYTDLVREIAKEGKHTFISTGMSNLEDIDMAVQIFREQGTPFELMHCVAIYPMDAEDANLNRIHTLRDRYGCAVGYSGHEEGITVSCAAAALGISSLKRHITLDRTMYGSDQAASVEPDTFRRLVEGVRTIERAMGDGTIHVNPKEMPTATKLRSHIPWKAKL